MLTRLPPLSRFTPALLLPRLVYAAFLLVMLLPGLTGCAADANRLPDRTGGVSLELLVHTADDTDARYRVERSGVLSFGGGLDAVLDRYSWEGPLTDGEIAELGGMLDRFDWVKNPPASSGRGGDRDGQVWRVTLQTPRGRCRFKTEGDHPQLSELEALLARASERRLEGFMRTLPKPDLQRR